MRNSENNLVQLFSWSAANHPDKCALTFREKSISYSDLDKKSNQLANHLISNFNISMDDRIAIIAGNSDLAVISMLGILKTGASYLCINPAFPFERIRAITSLAGVSHIFIDHTEIQTAVQLNIPAFVMDLQLDYLEESPDAPLIEINGQSLAYIIFTSGSTGMPKGVMIQHSAIASTITWRIAAQHLEPGQATLQLAPISFDTSVAEIYSALSAAQELVIVEGDKRTGMPYLVELIESKNIAHFLMIPSLYDVFIEEARKRNAFPRLQQVILAGEATRKELVEKHYRAFGNVRLGNEYGPSENAVITTFGWLDAADEVHIGQPIADTDVIIINEDKLPVHEHGQTGEILIGGERLFAGYIGDDALTNAAFISIDNKKYYASGDFGCWRNDGSIRYQGRNDDQLKIRGKRVELEEIASALELHAAVKTAVVCCHQSDAVKLIVAFVMLGQETSPESMRQHLATRMPDYMLPAEIIVVDQFPRNNSNKIDKNELLKIYKDRMEQREDDAALAVAGDKVEHEIQKIFQRGLNKPVGLHDNFFTLGGDSIIAIRVISEINESLGCKADVITIYKHYTVAGIANAIREMQRDGQMHTTDDGSIGESMIQVMNGSVIKDKHLIVDAYPMSDTSAGMLFHSMMDKDSNVYVEQSFIEFDDTAFDLNSFRAACSEVVKRHEILRSAFYLNEFDHPVQVVYDAASFDAQVEYNEISHPDMDACIRYINDWMEVNKQRVFDCTVPGLWSIRLFKMSDIKIGMLFTNHHAIMDGWSFMSMLTELYTLYETIKKNILYQAPPLRAGYKDYIRDQLKVKADEGTKKFWRDYLQDAVKTGLFFHRTIRDKKDKKTEYVHPESFVTRDTILSLAGMLNVSPKSIFISALCLLFKRTTGNSDVSIGLTTNGRPAVPDGDNIVGCFINLVPFRTIIPDAMPLREVYAVIDAELRRLKSYDKLSLSNILSEAGLNEHENPLFDMVFNYMDFHVIERIGNVPKMRSRIRGNGENNYPVTVNIAHWDNDHEFSMVYPRHLYTSSEIAQLIDMYSKIIVLSNEYLHTPARNFLLLLSQQSVGFPATPDLFESEFDFKTISN